MWLHRWGNWTKAVGVWEEEQPDRSMSQRLIMDGSAQQTHNHRDTQTADTQEEETLKWNILSSKRKQVKSMFGLFTVRK